MWKATAGLELKNQQPAEDDDWETDPDFVNDVSEQEQRWGSKTIEGSGRTAGAIDMDKLREETEQADLLKKKQERDVINPGYGYGGKYGVQTDRMDKSAVGHDYQGKVEKHASQKDYATGFGGKFGVQSDRVDKSALGWDHVEKVEKHESQKDYSKGFGGKFGVQEDRKDKSAVGWDHIEQAAKHESQVDHKVGFGGKFGVQKDRMDKSAAGYDQPNGKQQVGTAYTKVKPNIEGAKPSNLRAKFENLAKNTEEDTRKRAEEQKRLREEKDRRDREEAAKQTVVENTPREAAEEARTAPPKGSRSSIKTGREGGIGNAINAFNQMQSPTSEAPPPRKEPIVIPKAAKVAEVIEKVAEVEEKLPEVVQTAPAVVAAPPVVAAPVAVAAPIPDIIPSIEIHSVATPPEVQSPVREEPQPRHSRQSTQMHEEPQQTIAEEAEPLYQNQAEVAQATHQAPVPAIIEEHKVAAAAAAPAPPTAQAAEVEEAPVAVVPEEAIYSNSENLADYIEDTGVKAIALYDYQAADDDEISFDPDDEVTHIEMIDEGWWRGLCKNRYGLFPANYVQLINQHET